MPGPDQNRCRWPSCRRDAWTTSGEVPGHRWREPLHHTSAFCCSKSRRWSIHVCMAGEGGSASDVELRNLPQSCGNLRSQGFEEDGRWLGRQSPLPGMLSERCRTFEFVQRARAVEPGRSFESGVCYPGGARYVSTNVGGVEGYTLFQPSRALVRACCDRFSVSSASQSHTRKSPGKASLTAGIAHLDKRLFVAYRLLNSYRENSTSGHFLYA
jgi:hypothetical protein